MEIYIHIVIDKVNMNGEGFKVFAKMGTMLKLEINY
ncbi:PTS glucose transporter subunit IIA [Clostridium drakei]|nr:PTS glucose transporter subunit IIA [Clostridium drakei]